MKINFFDLDHTLLSGNSSFHFGRFLYQQKVFLLPQMLKLLGTYALHKAGFYSLWQTHNKIFQALFVNRDAATIKRHVTPFLDQEFEKLLYQPACRELALAKQQGHHTVILSNSPDFLVEKFAKRLGVNEWFASRYEIDEQEKFRRISTLVEGKTKADYVLKMVSTYGISKDDTVAYSDSYLDLPFLQAAGKAVIVNPDRRLRSICKKEKWTVI